MGNYASRTYGDRAFDLLNFIGDDKDLRKPVLPNVNVVRGEVIYSMERELCTNPIDFITRRTRLAFLDRKLSDEILPHICDIMAKHNASLPKRQLSITKVTNKYSK